MIFNRKKQSIEKKFEVVSTTNDPDEVLEKAIEQQLEVKIAYKTNEGHHTQSEEES